MNEKLIIKSGTDFRQFSKITIDFQHSRAVSVEEINVTESLPEDTTVKQLLEKYEGTQTIRYGMRQSYKLESVPKPRNQRIAKYRKHSRSNSETETKSNICLKMALRMPKRVAIFASLSSFSFNDVLTLISNSDKYIYYFRFIYIFFNLIWTLTSKVISTKL